MNSFLTQETPAKVMALVGTALFSLAFMFSVTVSDASFNGTPAPLASNVFQPTELVAVLDSASNSYSNFLNQNLFYPIQETYAFTKDNIDYIADNAQGPIVKLAGLEGLLVKTVDYGVVQRQVAGAHIEAIISD